MRKIVLTFGLIAGGILSAMMLLTLPFSEQIGFDKLAIIGYTTMALAFLLIYFGVRSYRDATGGTISFGRAFLVGLGITAVASACYVATWEVIYYKLTPDFVENYAAHSLEKARAAGKSAEEIVTLTAQLARYQEMYKNPLVNIAITFLEPLPVGLVMTLVAAGVLRRRPTQTPAPA